MNPREVLKRKLMGERGWCEYVDFWYWNAGLPLLHHCQGGLEQHEVLFTRAHAVTGAQKKAMNDERNCALLCHVHHGDAQHNKVFRVWWRDVRAAELYGKDAVEAYLAGWPTKLRRI